MTDAEKKLIRAVRAVSTRCWKTRELSFYSVADRDMKYLRAALRERLREIIGVKK